MLYVLRLKNEEKEYRYNSNDQIWNRVKSVYFIRVEGNKIIEVHYMEFEYPAT